MTKLAKLRNIGVSAHIDAGKTTLSERFLFFTGRIHRPVEVRSAGDGPALDFDPLEKAKGITISSAATQVQWRDHTINLIDTPGHVDFTVEVERSLRVLDGAVFVLCAVGGVQAQSITVDRQMARYGVPRVAFVNKMDRAGADPLRVVKQLREKLRCEPLVLQAPLFHEGRFTGVVDLLRLSALYFDGKNGEVVRAEAVPAEMRDEVEAARRKLFDQLSLFSDALAETLLTEQAPSTELLETAIRQATLARRATPVLFGAAYRNIGVQPLLDAVVRYLPSPLDGKVRAHGAGPEGGTVELAPDPERPLVGMAFKTTTDAFGVRTFFRIYQGTVVKGQSYWNQRTDRKERVARILRVHADQAADLDAAGAGDIVALVGVDAVSGDTYSSERAYCTLESLFVPEPVIGLAVRPVDRGAGDKLVRALQRFRKEDPTFRFATDSETGELVVSGMGKLHLEVVLQKIHRDCHVAVEAGAPQVHYREAPTRPATFDFTLSRQTGGPGQYAKVVGRIEPISAGESPAGGEAAEQFEFVDEVVAGRIPREYIPSAEKGFRSMTVKGPLAGYPIVGVRVVLEDGAFHPVDSSDAAFQAAARMAFREAFLRAAPVLLEPIMRIGVEFPDGFQGAVIGDLAGRRGAIQSTEQVFDQFRIEGEAPLAEVLDYADDLRSLTRGQGTFTLEFAHYQAAPASVQASTTAARTAFAAR